MQQDIEDIVYIDTEKTLQPYYDSRGIRLDVILADKDHTRYNLEMQAKNVIGDTGEALLPKRTRYYQSVIDMDMLKKGQDFDELDPLVLIFICTFDMYKEGRYVYTFKSRCLENLELELANDVTVKLVNAKGKHGQVNTLLKNFLRYVMTDEPVDEFTEDVARQIVAVKNDPIARRDYMVLATRIKDARRAGYVEGEAKGRADGLAEGREEGLAEGEAKKSRGTAIKMLKKHKPLSEIKEFTDMSEEEIVRLAKENGLEVIGG